MDCMTKDEFLRRAEKFFMVECHGLMSTTRNGQIPKGDQYNEDNDFYHNIEESARMVGISVDALLFAFLFKHITAIGKTVREGRMIEADRS